MACNWATEDYFPKLICGNQRAHMALEMLVDDLHTEKERTISTFLCHSGSEDFLWGLVQLLGNDKPRVAGNSAYIIGTLAESELGCHRILCLAKAEQPGSRKILSDLTRMLIFDDPESVMNAAGTMGTLAESAEGRNWMLSEPCVESMLDHITALLQVDNVWTASNAALVLARLCISEEGCSRILKHAHSHTILTSLILSLNVDEAGRGMNAAFAIGRLCDLEPGRERLLSLPDSEKMISLLAKMLGCKDTGASKNACFALSCLATYQEGHCRLLNNIHSEAVLRTLSQLLNAEDSETGWFAAMTLRTLASQPKGCLRLRESSEVHSALKTTALLKNINPDLNEEVMITLEILKHLDRPDPPTVTVMGPDRCHASWNQVPTKSGFDVQYQLFEGSHCCYRGTKCQCEVASLSPHTIYSFKVRAVTEVDESSLSVPTTVTTEEDVPEVPQNVRVLGKTATQLKIGWDPPEKLNGVSRGYYVYQGKVLVEHTTETSAIISGLTANTTCEIQVCAATSKGKGPRASCVGTTTELGAHASSKPHVQVLGRNEVHVSWEPPEVPMGRITRYDLSMNGKIVYSGTDLSFGVHRLTPDTEYTFMVTTLTNEGKFESKVTKKRTAKDEFDLDRPPLYQPPKKEEDQSQRPAAQKKTKSVAEIKSAHAKGSHVSCTLDYPQSVSSAVTSQKISAVETPRAEKDRGEDLLTPSPNQKSKKVVKTDSKKENRLSRTQREFLSSSTAASASGSQERPSTCTAPKVYSSHIDKVNGLSKSSLPVTLSYVSILVGEDQNLELDPLGTDFSNKKILIRSPMHCQKNVGLERSRTTLLPNSKFHHSNTGSRLSKLDLNEARNRDFPSHTNSNSIHGLPSNLLDRKSSVSDSGNISSKSSAWLPKPAIPNVDHLNGSKELSFSSDATSLHISSPRISMDLGVTKEKFESQNFLHHRKKSANGRKDSGHGMLFYTYSSARADSYLTEAHQAFLQRANTFISSHRPGLKKVHAISPPVHLNGSAPLTLPDSKLATQNKFIPMQLRTQPNNLTAGRLHRRNTTLSDHSRGGLPGHSVEALTRTHTQVNMKPHTANRSLSNAYHPGLASTE